MDIDRIREFIVLAKTCNYQTASDALYTTSSTLSRHISQMENELGSQLFDRTTRKVTLTDAGKCFLKKCEQIVLLYDEATAEINNATLASNNILTVAFTSNMRQYGILDVTYTLSERFPEMDIRMSESLDSSFNTLLHTQAIDFAYSSRLNLFDNDIKHCLFATDDVGLLVPKEHPFANRSAVRIEELKDETFIICNFYHTSERFFNECKKCGFTANVKMTTGNSFTAINAVASNQGISLLSRTHYLEHKDEISTPQHSTLSAVTMVDIIPKLSFNIYLLYLKNRPLTPAMKIYLNYVMKIMQIQKLESDHATPNQGDGSYSNI